jgi:hypothetical protein
VGASRLGGGQRQEPTCRGERDDVVRGVEHARIQAGERQDLRRIAAFLDQQVRNGKQRRDAYPTFAPRQRAQVFAIRVLSRLRPALPTW